MHFSNPWYLAAMIGCLGWFQLKLVIELLNVSRLGAPLPGAMRELMSEEDVQRTREYQGASARLDLLEDSAGLALLIAFWWAGGFGWIDGWVSGLGLAEIPSGLVLLSVLGLASSLLSLPFEAWRTFGVESEFGFNKTTVATFISDRVKGLLLMGVLGLPLAALVLWLFAHVPVPALWAWVVVAVFGLVMTWLGPRLIMPLFNKFTPMPDGELRQAIMALAQKLAFPVADISIADGSRRSTKANAFFAGFGKARRIALFDTLIEQHTQGEILAVLAHEVGHAKLGHVPKQVGLGLLVSGLMFGLMHWALHDPRLFSAFGVEHASTAMGLVLFMQVYGPWSHGLDLLVMKLSRKHEFEADHFAAQTTSAVSLADGLKKLSREHLSHPNPHPLAVAMHYSHPPLAERLQALRSS